MLAAAPRLASERSCEVRLQGALEDERRETARLHAEADRALGSKRGRLAVSPRLCGSNACGRRPPQLWRGQTWVTLLWGSERMCLHERPWLRNPRQLAACGLVGAPGLGPSCASRWCFRDRLGLLAGRAARGRWRRCWGRSRSWRRPSAVRRRRRRGCGMTRAWLGSRSRPGRWKGRGSSPWLAGGAREGGWQSGSQSLDRWCSEQGS